MKSTAIVPIAIALLQPQLIASEGIKVVRESRGKQQQREVAEPTQQEQPERDLYDSSTISLDVAEPCATVPAIVETNYTYDDDDVNGTETTLPPTGYVAPRPTPQPTIETVTITLSPTEAVNTPAPTVVAVEPIEPTPHPTEPMEPTPNPTPYPEDDGGLSDDAYIVSTPNPTRRPTTKRPTRKPHSYGYLPTSNSPSYDDVDDWASGWMPTNTGEIPDTADDDTDDWKGGYPIVDDANHVVDSKAGKASGKASSGKSGKGSKSGSSALTDDNNGWGGGLSKVSSLITSEVSSATTRGDYGVATVAAAVSGAVVYLYV